MRSRDSMAKPEPLILVRNLKKSFKVAQKKPGLAGAVKSLFSPNYKMIQAVSGIDFEISRGEVVGYVGPNGAGKSTTIKMLSGILYPSSGEVSIAGLNPFRQRRQFVMKLGVMFGQRSQLWWDLPVSESFDLLKSIYKIPEAVYQKNLAYFNELLEIHHFWGQPVRRLSLGQRVRADLAASLIHDPDVLFLDEPTVGLDILAREQFRRMIKQINREKKTTILITSHDLGDIELVVKRLILIDKGSVLFDGPLKNFMDKYSGRSRMSILFEDKYEKRKLPPGARILKSEARSLELEIETASVSYQELLGDIPRWGRIKDIHMDSTTLEEILADLYKG